MSATQIKALSERIDQLQQQLSKQDEWSRGLWLVLLDLVLAMRESDPQAAASLLQKWGSLDAEYERGVAGKKVTGDQTVEALEPRVLMARIVGQLSPGKRSARPVAADRPAPARRPPAGSGPAPSARRRKP